MVATGSTTTAKMEGKEPSISVTMPEEAMKSCPSANSTKFSKGHARLMEIFPPMSSQAQAEYRRRQFKLYKQRRVQRCLYVALSSVMLLILTMAVVQCGILQNMQKQLAQRQSMSSGHKKHAHPTEETPKVILVSDLITVDTPIDSDAEKMAVEMSTNRFGDSGVGVDETTTTTTTTTTAKHSIDVTTGKGNSEATEGNMDVGTEILNVEEILNPATSEVPIISDGTEEYTVQSEEEEVKLGVWYPQSSDEKMDKMVDYLEK